MKVILAHWSSPDQARRTAIHWGVGSPDHHEVTITMRPGQPEMTREQIVAELQAAIDAVNGIEWAPASSSARKAEFNITVHHEEK
jgi:hypothetical protein